MNIFQYTYVHLPSDTTKAGIIFAKDVVDADIVLHQRLRETIERPVDIRGLEIKEIKPSIDRVVEII